MISVCIPTYNGEKYIHQQIESILFQLSANDEIIISDDSSIDSTLEIIKSFNDERIRIFSGNTFHSPIYNLEYALKQAKGDFIFLSDQDDIWTKDKVKICLKELENNNLVIHDAIIVDSDGNELFPSFYKLNHTKFGKFFNLIKNGYIGCCIAFNSRILQTVLPFPTNIPMHDSWIGNIAAFKYGHVKFITEKLILYRRHNNNASPTGEKSNRKLNEKINDRLGIIKNLLRAKKYN